MKRHRTRVFPFLTVVLFAAIAPSVRAADGCSALPNAARLKQLLRDAAAGKGVGSTLGPGTNAGGLFGGEKMWAAVVDRDGRLCAAATSTDDPTQVWPGSQAIAKAKAYTANAFSLDSLALSTARLYTLVQPGHSLYGLNQSNPFEARLLAPTAQRSQDRGQIAGGIITFGGGVPVYDAKGKILGGLGVSGDTACADHEVAKRVRDLAHANPHDGSLADDITYSSADKASVFTHPLCVNTLRNGKKLGDEAAASGY